MHSRHVVNDVHCTSVVGEFQHGDVLAEDVGCGNAATGNFRIGVANGNEFFVMVVDTVCLAELRLDGAVGLQRNVVVRPDRVGNGVAVPPQHCKTSVGIGVRSSTTAFHAYFLAVIDEGIARHKQIHAGCKLQRFVLGGKSAGYPVHIVVGKEGSHYRIGIAFLNGVVVVFHFVAEHASAAVLDVGHNCAVDVGKGKVETVDGPVIVDDGNFVGPVFPHNVHIFIVLFAGVVKPSEQLHVACVVAEIEVLYGVQTETVHAHVGQPKTHNVFHRFLDGGIVVVEFRHITAEIAFVNPFVAVGIGGKIVPVSPFVAYFYGIVVVVGIGGVPRSPCLLRLLEPFVVLACVVENKVDYYVYSTFVALCNKVAHVFHGTVVGVDCFVVDYVVLVITERNHNGHEPDSRYAQTFAAFGVAVVEVVQTVDDALQIAHSVVVAVGKTADKNFVECAVVIVDNVGFEIFVNRHTILPTARQKHCRNENAQKHYTKHRDFPFHVFLRDDILT